MIDDFYNQHPEMRDEINKTAITDPYTIGTLKSLMMQFRDGIEDIDFVTMDAANTLYHVSMFVAFSEFVKKMLNISNEMLDEL